MRCPTCGHAENRVIDSREARDGSRQLRGFRSGARAPPVLRSWAPVEPRLARSLRTRLSAHQRPPLLRGGTADPRGSVPQADARGCQRCDARLRSVTPAGTAPGRIELIDIEEPELPERPPDDAPGEILFQPELACLCGSDIPFFEHSDEIPQPEIGHSLHEMIGRVVATNGQRFRPGERVLAVPVNQCGLFERYVVSEDRAIPLDPRVPDDQAVLGWMARSLPVDRRGRPTQLTVARGALAHNDILRFV